jgi:RNA polymerase sigma-70 factor (ECF subfamily)
LPTTDDEAPATRPTTGPADLVVATDDHVARARQGDEAAFVALYRSVHPALVRYLTVLVPGAAEDVAGETWVQVCRDLHTFDGGISAFRGWISRIGRNRAIDHARAEARRPQAPMPAWDLPDLADPHGTEDMADEAIGTRSAMELISLLPPDQAEAVLLRAVMGLDAASAGRVLGKRAGAVRTAAHRGLRNLAARLDTDPAGPAAADGRRVTL